MIQIIRSVLHVFFLVLCLPFTLIFFVPFQLYRKCLLKKKEKEEPKTIFITGAGAGLGKALAIEYSNIGINLILLGRTKSKLLETKEICLTKGANVEVFECDIKDQAQMKKIIDDMERKYSIDLVISNAAIISEQLSNQDTSFQIKEIFDVNINGSLNTILPIITLFEEKKKGQICIISSLTGHVGSLGIYPSTKSCLTFLGHYLRQRLSKLNIKVNVVTPGWIQTSMAESSKSYLFGVVSPEYSAKVIRKGLLNNDSEISFPEISTLFMYIIGTLPFTLIEGAFR